MAAQVPGETSTGISTWDATSGGIPAAYRPGLPDVNSAQLANRSQAPPNAPTFPTANQLNGTFLLVCAIGAVIPNATISVKYTGGNPVIDYGTACGGLSPGATSPVVSGAVGVVRTPGGAGSGDVLLYWAQGVFPPPASRPKGLTINGTTPGIGCADWTTYTPASITYSAVRVVTVNASDVATDMPFTIDVM
jgi:hypothetical protein